MLRMLTGTPMTVVLMFLQHNTDITWIKQLISTCAHLPVLIALWVSPRHIIPSMTHPDILWPPQRLILDHLRTGSLSTWEAYRGDLPSACGVFIPVVCRLQWLLCGHPPQTEMNHEGETYITYYMTIHVYDCICIWLYICDYMCIKNNYLAGIM